MTAQWEREASIGLRQGHTVALHQYMEHQRVHSGAADKLVQAAFERWDTARKTGRSLMVMARTNDRLDDFNQLARSHMRESGELRGSDVQIGKLAIAIGDEILTRRNARWIRTTSKRSVINGDRWEVTRIRPDGALDVTSMDGRGRRPCRPTTRPLTIRSATPTARRSTVPKEARSTRPSFSWTRPLQGT